MDRKAVIIKKYENRRLYDTTHSRYINLDEVAQMVKDGCDVQVLDASTGEDITRLILTQIIAENAKAPDSAFPLDVLRQMVVASGRATQENTLKYMKAVLDMYQNAYRVMAPPVNPFEFMRGQNSQEAAPVSGDKPRSTPGTRDEQEATELKRRVEELEAMVSKLTPNRTKVKRKARARRG